MEVIIFEKEAYHAIQRQLFNEFRKVVKEAKKEALAEIGPACDWISTEEAMEMLGVESKTTLQKLRDRRLIKFSKFGGIIRYSEKSILAFLESHVQ